MIAAALLLVVAGQDAGAMMDGARGRLSARCEKPDGSPCDAAPPDAEFRVYAEPEAAGVVGKDRAVRDNGQRCAVTGPTLCTRPPRRILSTKIPK